MSDQPSRPLPPPIQAILDNARSNRAKAITQQRASEDADAKRRRAHDAWVQLSAFRGEAVPAELTGEGVYQRTVELIIALGKILNEDGWGERISAVQPGPEPKTYALAMLRAAMEGDAETVTAMYRRGSQCCGRSVWPQMGGCGMGCGMRC